MGEGQFTSHLGNFAISVRGGVIIIYFEVVLAVHDLAVEFSFSPHRTAVHAEFVRLQLRLVGGLKAFSARHEEIA